MLRNMQFEQNVITAAVVDRETANRFYDANSLKQVMSICDLDGLVSSDGRFQIHLDKRHESSGFALEPYMNYNDFIGTAQSCGHLITERQDGIDLIANNHFRSRFPALRFAKYTELGMSENQTASNNDLSYAQQIKDLLKLKTGWNHPYNKTNGKWQPVMKPLMPWETYRVYNIDNVCKAQFIGNRQASMKPAQKFPKVYNPAVEMAILD
jgi:hypothetical protein